MNRNESKYFNTARKMDEALIMLLEKKGFEYITIKEICNSINEYDVIIVAYENEKQNYLKTVLQDIKNILNEKNKLKIGIVIGPEGGLEEQDVQTLKENGAKVITLGSRILRTETVALNMYMILIRQKQTERLAVWHLHMLMAVIATEAVKLNRSEENILIL